jgi:glycerol-3-phosphate cytidylyltransferase
MSKKIKSEKEILKITEKLKKQGKKIVFTNGCFDILHAGHVMLLQKAKTFGDILIVGLNSDSSVKKIKGPLRPIFSEKERKEILCALECVDYVVLFSEINPCKIISEIRPDIHVKGGDYDPADFLKMPEAEIVKKYGGTVKIVELKKGISTSNITRKIKNMIA